MHHFIFYSLVLSLICLRVNLCSSPNEELTESGRGIIDIQNEGKGSVSYIIHPDNLPDPHFTPLQHLLWQATGAANERTDKLIDTAMTSKFSNLLVKNSASESSGSSDFETEKTTSEKESENYLVAPIDPAVSARVEALALSMIKEDSLSSEVKEPPVHNLHSLQSNESNPIKIVTFQFTNSSTLEPPKSAAKVKTSPPEVNLDLSTFFSLSDGDKTGNMAPLKFEKLNLGSEEESLLTPTDTHSSETENYLMPQSLVASNYSLNDIKTEDIALQKSGKVIHDSEDENLLTPTDTHSSDDEMYLIPQSLVASNYSLDDNDIRNASAVSDISSNSNVDSLQNGVIFNGTEDSTLLNDLSTEAIDEGFLEMPILNNTTEEVLDRFSKILLLEELEEKLNGTFGNISHLEATEMFDTFDTSPDVVTSFGENPPLQQAIHTPRYDDTSSGAFEDVKNFLTDLANSDGFQNAFLGDLIKNFGNLDHNALKLIYSLLIKPLTEKVINTKERERKPMDQSISNENYEDDFNETWNPSLLIRPDAAGDGLWRPIIRKPKSPSSANIDHGVEVITAPNAHEFEVVLSSSFMPGNKKHLSGRQVAQNRAGFAAVHPPPKNLVLGHEMPPPEALKALPPGAILIPPSQVIRKPVIPKLPENASPKMGSGSLSDLLPNFPFFGSKKEKPAMVRENPSKFSSIPSFFSSLFGKSKPKERPPSMRRIRIDHRPIYPPPPVYKPKFIHGKKNGDVSSHSDFNHGHADTETRKVFDPELRIEDMDGSASHTMVHSDDSNDRLSHRPLHNGNVHEYARPNSDVKTTENKHFSSNSYHMPPISKGHEPKLDESPFERLDTLYESRYEYDDSANDSDSYPDSYYEDNVQMPSEVKDRSETTQYILPLNYDDNKAGIPSKKMESDVSNKNNYEEFSVDRDDRLSNRYYYQSYDETLKKFVESESYDDDPKDIKHSEDNSENPNVYSEPNDDYYDAPTSDLRDNYDNGDATLDDHNDTSAIDISTDEENIPNESLVEESIIKDSRDKFNDALDLLKKDPETILYSNIGPVDIPEGTIIPKEDFEKALGERKYKNKFIRIDNNIAHIATTQKSPPNENMNIVPGETTVVQQGSVDQNTIDGPSYPSLTREHDAAVSHLWNNVKLTLQKEDPENTDLKMLDEKPFLKVPFPSSNYTEFEGMKTNRDERSLMAYILIGSCCGLALLSIIGIVVIVRFKKTCATRQIGGKVRRSHLSGRHNSLGNLSLPDGGDNKSGHKLGSWFTGRNEQFGNSGKLRSNMTLPEVIKAGSTRDLLSLSSASSHTSSLMELSKDEERSAKEKRNSADSDDRILPTSSSWLHGNSEASLKEEDLKQSKSVRSKSAKGKNFVSDEAINSPPTPMGAKSYHYYGESSREFENSKHHGVTSYDSEDFERATTGHSHYHSDSEFDKISYDHADSRELGALAKNRAKQVRSMDSEELGEEISRDLRNFQNEFSKNVNSSDQFNRTSNAASFSRDNIQNEVFLEFDKMLRQHTHPSTLGGGTATMKSNFSETPPQSPTFNESANSEDISHNKLPYMPPKLNPPAPPPRPPKPSRFSPDSSTHSPRSGRARAPTPKNKNKHSDESSDDERLI